MSGAVLHRFSRALEGAEVAFNLPLCWDAPERAKPDHNDEFWWLSWDLGAVNPTLLMFGVTDADVDCRDCLEWMHA